MHGEEEEAVQGRAECIERNGWQEASTWQSKSSYTEQRRLCTHEETEKPEKEETTGKIVFIWNYTIVVKNAAYKGLYIIV